MIILPELILLTVSSVVSPHQPLLSSVDAMVFAPAPIAAAFAPQGHGQGHGQGRGRGHQSHGQGHGYGHHGGGGSGIGGGTPEPASYLLMAGVLLAYGMFRVTSKQSIV